MKRYLAHLKQILSFIRFKVRARYRGSVLGLLWVIVIPTITYFAQLFLIKSLAGEAAVNFDLAIYLMMGSLSWYYLSQTLEMNTSSIVANGEFLKNHPISPFVFATSTCIENALNTFLAFVVLALTFGFKGKGVACSIFYPQLFFGIILLFVFVFYSSRILAILNVYFRDVRFITTFILQVLFFISPILFYPIKNIHYIYYFQHGNPFFYLLSSIQSSYVNRTDLPISIINIVSLLFVVLVILLYFALWSRTKKRILLYV